MTEYGAFDGEAFIRAGFFGDPGKAEAEARAARIAAVHPAMNGAYQVLEMCPDHGRRAKRNCGECAGTTA